MGTNINDYGSCCNNMDCTYPQDGAAGNGYHYGNCCNTLECTFSERKIGGKGTCTSYVIPPEPPCADDQAWRDKKHGDGTDGCEDMTRNFCDSTVVKDGITDGTNYGSEARYFCPFSCNLC